MAHLHKTRAKLVLKDGPFEDRNENQSNGRSRHIANITQVYENVNFCVLQVAMSPCLRLKQEFIQFQSATSQNLMLKLLFSP